MSVMSAAETGSSPDVPRQRLRLAAPAGQDAGDPAAGSPGAGAGEQSGPAAPAADDGWPRLAAGELRATELRVREVRVVREASVRTLRGSPPVAAQAQTAGQARAVQVQAQTRAQVVSQAASQAWAASAQTRTPGGVRSASQTRVVTHRRAATRTRVTTRTRAVRPGAVRLTRRGRLVVTVLVLLAAIVTATLLWATVAGSAQASSRGGPAPRSPYQGLTQVVVQPGQTLWSIAAATEPSANAWAVVQQIIEVNALNGPQVRAGEQLWVPRA
jgi:LysM repeat protein